MKLSKDEFLESIKNLSPEQINKIILENGKKKKPRKVIFYEDDNS